MRPRTQKQPQVKKEPCRVLDDVDVDVDVETGNLINFVSVFEVLSFPSTYFLFLFTDFYECFKFFLVNFARHRLFFIFSFTFLRRKSGAWLPKMYPFTHDRL